MNRFLSAACACGFLALLAHPAEARLTRLVITNVQSPTFGATAFGSGGAVGPYEKLTGVAHGEVDPEDPRNALITDIDHAPRNARGMVEYSMDVYILKPVDMQRSNHKLFMEINNRGNKLFGAFNRAPITNDPTTAADAGGAFLMNQGYALAWNGWDPTAAAGNGRMTIQTPVAIQEDGTPVTGPSYEYLVFDNATTLFAPLTYPDTTLDPAAATLTVREHLTDPPTILPVGTWQYASSQSIQLLPVGTTFRQSAIYEFVHTATQAKVAGLGFAATRDFVSFLRHAQTDDVGNPNPLAAAVKQVDAFAISQPARYLNDFVWLGFNQDELGQAVFDAIENWIGAGDGVALNVRFAQPGRTERNRQNHLYPEGIFPFAFQTLHDPLTGHSDGRNLRCMRSDTCPKLFQVISANEYWVKAGSLVHTDTFGNDLADPPNVRYYLLSGLEHTVAGNAPFNRGVCQQYQNPTDPNPALRALLVALDAWTAQDVPPPHSAVPRVRDGTAVFSQPLADGLGVVPQQALGWPDIPLSLIHI